MHSETMKFIRRDAADWEASRTRGGHIRLRHPQAAHDVILAATPSDRRALLNAKAQMRRALREGTPR